MTPPPRTAFPWLLTCLGTALALAVGVFLFQLARSSGGLMDLPHYDFVAFWSAARLNQAGADPYDPDQLRALQQSTSAGQTDVLVMWPAPWTLTILGPFCRLDSHQAHLLWLCFLLALLLAGADWGWHLYGGAPGERWVAWVLVFTFLPSYFVLVTGQLGPLILIGLLGFLYGVRRRRDGLAGAFLVLVAVKPQLTFLFWPALLAWVIRTRRWRVLLGGALALTAALVPLLCENPRLPIHYWVALTQRTQTHSHLSPLAGTALRLLIGREHFWLQFVPLVPGLVWLGWYVRRHLASWDWQRQLPPLLFASFLTAPYGAWPFDLVVLLPGLLPVAVLLPHASRRDILLTVACHLAINLLALALVLEEVEYFWFLWMTPALLLFASMQNASSMQNAECRMQNAV